MTPFIKSIVKEICNNLGYKTRYSNYAKLISSDVYSTLFFDIAHFGVKGHSFVAPRIGVLHLKVEKLLYDVSRMEWYRKPDVPTISEHIGYILPCNKWTEWDFAEGACDTAAKAFDMQDKIQRCALSYSAQYSDLGNIIAYAEELPYGSAFNHKLIIRLPIMYYLAGRKDLGLKYIERICTNHPDNLLFTLTYRTNYNNLQ